MAWHGSGFFSYVRSGDDKPKVTRALLLRVLSYARDYWWHITGMLFAILLTTGLSLLTPLVFRNMIDVAIPKGDLRRLMQLSLILLAVPAISGIVSVIQRRLNATVGEGIIFDLRSALFSRIQHMPLRFFTHTKSGELISRLNNDVIGAQNAISNTVVNIITNLIESVALFAVMFTLEWRMTIVSLIVLPLFLILAKRLGFVLRDIAREAMSINAQMNAHMNETLNIGGALLIKLFGRSKEEVDRFRERASSVRDIGIRRAVVGSTFFVFIGLISSIGTAIAYGLGGYYVITNVFTVGTIVAFGAYLTQLYGTLQGLTAAPVDFSTSMVSFERVFEIMDLPQDIEEKDHAIALQKVNGELEFKDVTFNYNIGAKNYLKDVKRYGSQQDVGAVLSLSDKKDTIRASDNVDTGEISQARDVALSGISFTAHPGDLVALVGPSGAGKTTMTYLIPRLYDPTEGAITIDGIDLREVTLDSLSDVIGMVTQETYLFHDTIRTNLTYAKLDASQSEIEFAAKSANIHNFIMDLPDGYDTIVGERGYRLSGGEKQRIALARVILKDPRILVLDEATSHLDSESESLIQEALKHVMAGRTSIVIAHRLSTILAADLILVMDRGQIVERGKHSELLALNGLYSQLYETQFKREPV